ncbi:hypothetical protein LC55x_0807 [Lysobacter capsici]|nr:hypothetical protein LC55x_0807 [Lysobacter capsici]
MRAVDPLAGAARMRSIGRLQAAMATVRPLAVLAANPPQLAA